MTYMLHTLHLLIDGLRCNKRAELAMLCEGILPLDDLGAIFLIIRAGELHLHVWYGF